MEIIGTEAVVNVSTPFKPGLKESIVLTRGEQEQRIDIQGQQLYIGEVEDMADAVLDGKPALISLADSRGNIAAILGLLRSAETGQPVRL